MPPVVVKLIQDGWNAGFFTGVVAGTGLAACLTLAAVICGLIAGRKRA